MNLEETVRSGVQDLAAEAPAIPDLARVARHRGRRLRRQRRAGVAAGVLVLAAATASPYLVTQHESPAPLQQVAPVPQRTDWWTAPYQLPGGMIVTALTRRNVGSQDEPGGRTVRDGNILLNRTTGQYVVLPSSYYTIFGAPVGERAVAQNGEGGSGIVDASGGRGIWQDVSYEPDWSADGSQILFDSEGGFSILDVATGQVAARLAPDAVTQCPALCWFSWLPGGKEVAAPVRDPEITQAENKPDTIKSIAIYDTAHGKRTRLVPVPGVPVRQDAWSPDGSKVLIRDQKSASGGPIRVAQVKTGRTLATIPAVDVHFTPGGQILALVDGAAQLYDARGRLLQTQQLPADFEGRAVSVGIP